jgi:hypothetical protein
MKSPFIEDEKVNCEKHGIRPSVLFQEPGYPTIQVCFTCYKEKVTEGLFNHYKKAPFRIIRGNKEKNV